MKIEGTPPIVEDFVKILNKGKLNKTKAKTDMPKSFDCLLAMMVGTNIIV